MQRTEYQLETSITIVTRNDDSSPRGGASVAARVNKLIKDAIERDGFEIQTREGYAIPIACTTDVYRMTTTQEGEEDVIGH